MCVVTLDRLLKEFGVSEDFLRVLSEHKLGYIPHGLFVENDTPPLPGGVISTDDRVVCYHKLVALLTGDVQGHMKRVGCYERTPFTLEELLRAI